MVESAGGEADVNSADILRGGRVVFDVRGNKYRLVAWVNYHYGVLCPLHWDAPRERRDRPADDLRRDLL
jgi:hypothetical protein